MVGSPVALVPPTVRTPCPEENVIFEVQLDKPKEVMKLCYGKTKRESTLIQCLLGCMFFCFSLVVIVTFLLIKVSVGSAADSVCEGVNITEMVCYPCGQYGVPGVKSILRSANDVCCVAKEEIDPVLAKMTSSPPTHKTSTHDDTNKKRRQQRRKSPSARLHLNLTSTAERHDGIMVWQTSQFDDVYYLHDSLRPTYNGSVGVRFAGIYRITVHVCLDAVNNVMKQNRTRENLDLFIIKKSTQIVHQDRVTLLRGTYNSQTLEMNLILRQNENFHIQSTWRFLYKMSICNSLDINLIG